MEDCVEAFALLVRLAAFTTAPYKKPGPWKMVFDFLKSAWALSPYKKTFASFLMAIVAVNVAFVIATLRAPGSIRVALVAIGILGLTFAINMVFMVINDACIAQGHAKMKGCEGWSKLLVINTGASAIVLGGSIMGLIARLKEIESG